MKRLMTLSLTAVALALCASPASAHGRRHSCASDCAPACAPAVQYTTVWVEKTVTAYKTEWHERDVKVVVHKPIFTEVETPHSCTVLVPEWKPVTKTITVLTPVPKVVERDVVCCRMVPVTLCDPCTGCPYTVCKPETYVQKVKYTVTECVPTPKEVTYNVCTYKEEVRKWTTKHVVCTWKEDTEMRKERYCVSVPYPTTVKVPVCVPVCPPPPVCP